MPIVLPVADDSELTQGDILRDVPFYVTGVDTRAAADREVRFALVVSRPCKAIRDDIVVVAPVIPYPVLLSEFTRGQADPVGGLDRMRRILSAIRDGIKGSEFCDALYLGAFRPTDSTRYAAQLHTLATACVPAKSEDRKAWVRDHRVARLSSEFVRDLHTRMILTFTRLGFDDQHWLSNEDLEIMITAGQAEIAKLEGDLIAAKQAVQFKQAENRQTSTAQQDAIGAKETAIERARVLLQPYLAEREERRQ